MKKNPIIAFLLSFIPGGGMFYLGRFLRGLFYSVGEMGLVIVTILFLNGGNQFGLVPFILGIVLYLVSLIDTAVAASRMVTEREQAPERSSKEESERFYTIILSFIPGVGHFQLGLMNRGMTLLTAFLGLGVMVFFVAILAGRSEFLIFLAILPVIWVYGFFDAMQQLNKKHRGEVLVDRSILEDFESRREEGKKSKSIATFLSIFPGAGHLYLGLQRRGIQLMAAFLFSIYILDVLRLGIFMFLIPIIWFYSFFDGLQKASKYEDEQIEDEPVINYLLNHQRWIGIGLVLLGIYYLTTNIVIPVFSPVVYEMFNVDFTYWWDRYFQTAIVCVLFIWGGIKLLLGSKERGKA